VKFFWKFPEPNRRRYRT